MNSRHPSPPQYWPPRGARISGGLGLGPPPPATQRARHPTASARNSPSTRAAKSRASAEAASSPSTTLSKTSTAKPSPPDKRFVAAHATTKAASTAATSTLRKPPKEPGRSGGRAFMRPRKRLFAPTEPPLSSSALFETEHVLVSFLYIRRMAHWRSVR